jgi:hypothetical protein
MEKEKEKEKVYCHYKIQGFFFFLNETSFIFILKGSIYVKSFKLKLNWINLFIFGFLICLFNYYFFHFN